MLSSLLAIERDPLFLRIRHHRWVPKQTSMALYQGGENTVGPVGHHWNGNYFFPTVGFSAHINRRSFCSFPSLTFFLFFFSFLFQQLVLV